MENDMRLYLLSSNGPVLTDGTQDQSRVSYGCSVGERISSSQRKSHITEIEGEDRYKRSVRHHPSRNHAAQAAIKFQQHKKARQRTRKRDENAVRALTQDELESDRYLQYREKYRQEDKNKVWPDELEAAFQRGMLTRETLYLVRLTFQSIKRGPTAGKEETTAKREALWAE